MRVQLQLRAARTLHVGLTHSTTSNSPGLLALSVSSHWAGERMSSITSLCSCDSSPGESEVPSENFLLSFHAKDCPQRAAATDFHS